MLYTTLNKIREISPCEDSWKRLLTYLNKTKTDDKSLDFKTILQAVLTYLNKTKADDEPLDFKTILQAVGIKDAILFLRTQEFKDYYKFVTRVAYSVLPIYENKYPEDKRPRLAIEAVDKFMNGEISKKELETFRAAAWAAAWDAAGAAWAADAVAAADVAARAAWAAVAYAAARTDAAWAAGAAAAAVAVAADAADAAGAAADDVAAAAGAREKKWQEIEQIFVEECLN